MKKNQYIILTKFSVWVSLHKFSLKNRIVILCKKTAKNFSAEENLRKLNATAWYSRFRKPFFYLQKVCGKVPFRNHWNNRFPGFYKIFQELKDIFAARKFRYRHFYLFKNIQVFEVANMFSYEKIIQYKEKYFQNRK